MTNLANRKTEKLDSLPEQSGYIADQSTPWHDLVFSIGCKPSTWQKSQKNDILSCFQIFKLKVNLSTNIW